jgi:hypothetical protein
VEGRCGGAVLGGAGLGVGKGRLVGAVLGAVEELCLVPSLVAWMEDSEELCLVPSLVAWKGDAEELRLVVPSLVA